MGRTTLDENTQPPTSDYEKELEELTNRYTDYIECEEWHIHDNTGEHEGSTSDHKDFDDKKFKQAVIDLNHKQTNEALDELQHRMLKKNEELELSVRRATLEGVQVHLKESKSMLDIGMYQGDIEFEIEEIEAQLNNIQGVEHG